MASGLFIPFTLTIIPTLKLYLFGYNLNPGSSAKDKTSCEAHFERERFIQVNALKVLYQ